METLPTMQIILKNRKQTLSKERSMDKGAKYATNSSMVSYVFKGLHIITYSLVNSTAFNTWTDTIKFPDKFEKW